MNKNELMQYFIAKDNSIWQMIGYCSEPTVIMQNVVTKEQRHIIPNSSCGRNFVKLVPENINNCPPNYSYSKDEDDGTVLSYKW